MIKSEHKVVQVYNNFGLKGHDRSQIGGFSQTVPETELFVVCKGLSSLCNSPVDVIIHSNRKIRKNKNALLG